MVVGTDRKAPRFSVDQRVTVMGSRSRWEGHSGTVRRAWSPPTTASTGVSYFVAVDGERELLWFIEAELDDEVGCDDQ